MPLELLLQISVAALSSMGTLLMGIGENNVSLPVLGFFVALTSLYFTDHLGWLRLNSTFANLTALVAGWFAIRDMSTFGSDTWLMAIAHLLAYLQFIMLYQEKNSRIYWLLLTLSLLQVAVAAALNLEVWFGIVLFFYLLTGLACLTLFFMYRERLRYDPKAPHEPVEFDLLSLFGPRRRQAYDGLQSGVQIDSESTRLGWSFVKRVGVMGFWTVWLTAALFLLFPRTGRTQTNWSSPHGQSRHVTGFADEVNINDLGELLNSSDPVCKLWLYDFKTGLAQAPIEGLYLRGTMLNKYNEGQWSRSAKYVGDPPMLEAPPPSDVEIPLIRQVIEIEPLNTSVLFAISPWAAITPRPEVQADGQAMHLTRPSEIRGSKFVYELYTWGVFGPVQPTETPNYAFDPGRFGRSEVLRREALRPETFRQLTQMPNVRRGDVSNSLPRLRAWAKSKVEPLPHFVADNSGRMFDFTRQQDEMLEQRNFYENLPIEEVRSRARSLESALRDGGEFTYTLQAKQIDATLDPVEDFLINRKEGHCEYYASALALALRSCGIPARIVTGFSGPEWNAMGQFYQVRQYHAHSWVECYLPGGVREDGAMPGGYWMRLDATPSVARLEGFRGAEPTFPALQQMFDFVDYLWAGYVLGLDSQRQQQRVYRPLQESFSRAWEWMQDPSQWWKSLVDSWRNVLKTDGRALWNQWANWKGVVMVWAIGALLYAAWRAAVAVYHWLRPARPAVAPSRETAANKPTFYQQLEAVFEQLQVAREPAQTPRAPAIAAALILAETPSLQAYASLPRRAVEAYYRFRFGGMRLDPRECLSLEVELRDLMQAIQSSRAEFAVDHSAASPETT